MQAFLMFAQKTKDNSKITYEEKSLLINADNLTINII